MAHSKATPASAYRERLCHGGRGSTSSSTGSISTGSTRSGCSFSHEATPGLAHEVLEVLAKRACDEVSEDGLLRFDIGARAPHFAQVPAAQQTSEAMMIADNHNA